ncbi:uncharacterized protein LOC112555777 [Pomacea canaliculata]|uniref:uncharacterized protein LOC112555777 n=1 Tax=Pomacea canaliculata TaxID=400727 RepID=UPI000D73F6FF|nr:uncharacterized protein LOC112555777 [Pomacea canaliculata]
MPDWTPGVWQDPGAGAEGGGVGASWTPCRHHRGSQTPVWRPRFLDPFRQVQENALEALENVFFEKISLRTDVDTFARHLLNKYKGAGLKIFIDECPWITTMKEQETRLLSCIDDLKAITDLYQNILEMCRISDFTEARPNLSPSPSVENSKKNDQSPCNKARKKACNKTRKTKQEHDGLSTSTSRDPNNETNVEVSENTAAAASKINGFYYRRSQSRYDAGLLPAQVYFKKMESHVRHAEKRISFLRTGTAGPRLMSMDHKWAGLVLQIANEHEQIMEMKTEVEDRLCGSHAAHVDVEGITGVLDEVDKRMLSAMGFLFHFNTSLYFFLIQKLMQAITRLQKEDENLDVALWTSSAFSTEIPKAFAEKKLELSLRCPPAVQELLIHLEPDLIIEQSPPRYTYQTRTFEVNPPLPTVGPEVMLLDHGDHVTSVKEVNDCPTCGQALADYLLGTLRVGACAGSLRPRDITISGSPVHSERCALLEQLRQRGLPLLMESELDPTPPSFPDKVLVIGGNYLQGLESKIVVYVPEVNRVPLNQVDGRMQEGGDVSLNCPDWVQRLGRWNRSYLWFVASRTLSHLIVFKI